MLTCLHIWKRILCCLLGSTLFVILLFVYSSHTLQRHNDFIRLFPPHPVLKSQQIDIKFNSFYIAGHDNKNLYLSNRTAPLFILKVKLKTLDTTHISIQLQDNLTQLRSNTKTIVTPPDFYILDGITPKIFRGSTSTWQAYPINVPGYFSSAIPLNGQTLAIRAISSKTGDYELGTISLSNAITTLNTQILTPQTDGIFSSDGILKYNLQIDKLIYVYHYRNQYLTIDHELKSWKSGQTIDTNAIAKIKLSKLTEGTLQKMTAPPLMVNRLCDTHGDYLLVCSSLMSKNEKRSRFLDNDVIDVYSLEERTYKFSFYIPHYKGHPMNGFAITDQNLIAIHNRYLITYDMAPNLFPFIKDTNN